MPLRFASPFWLILLPAIIPAAMMWRRYLHSPGVPHILRSVTFLRSGALLCLVLVLAGTQWLARQKAVDIIFLADVSESVPPAAQERGLEFIRATMRQLRASDRAALIAFGKEAYLDQPLSSKRTSRLPAIKRIEAAPGRGETDLQNALQLALATTDAERNVRIVVISDGLATSGNAETVLPYLQNRNVTVDAFLFRTAPQGEASIEQVLAPSRVGKNQPFTIRVVTAATEKTSAKLRLFRNGVLVSDKTVTLDVGRNVFDYSGFKEDAGVNTFEARIEVPKDTHLQNNVGYTTVTVEGPNRLLLVTDNTAGSAALLNALRRQGMRVDVTNTTALPANANALSSYGALLLHDISALKLSLTQQTQIAAYVRDLGGGLVVVGGHNSYGLGGYYQTPLETIMPVTMDAPQTLVMPSLAILLVLDKSGSMAQTQGKLSKVDLAKEAALGVLDVVNDRDLFGVLAFESVTKWIVPLQPAVDRLQMAKQIGTLTADGGTEMGSAMLEALAAMSKTQAMVKHLIILSDGQSMEHDFAGTTAKLKAAGVTVSTVAIGTDADRTLLENIAKWGNGRFYYTNDIRTIPQIFTTEALVVSRPLAVEERFRPKPHQPAPFLTGINLANLPALDGYVLTSPKATSTIHLQTADESPLLASWRHGLGRVVAFTSDVTSTWAGNWLKWDGFGSFWSQTVRWALRPESAQSLRPYFDIHEGEATLVVDAVDNQGRFINFLHLQAEVLSPGGERQTLNLVQSAPGQYQAAFAAGEQGAWLAAVADTTDPRFHQPAMVGAVLPYPAEYRLTGVDAGGVERLVKATGGKLFDAARVPAAAELRSLLKQPKPVRAATPLTTPLLFLAFLLFLLDIVVRYLPPGVAERVEQWLYTHIPVWLAKRMESPTTPGSGSYTDQSTAVRELSEAADMDAAEAGEAAAAAQAEKAGVRDTLAGSAANEADENAASASVAASLGSHSDKYLRLDDLIKRRRAAETTLQPHYNFSDVDPAKAAARYLARLRSAKKNRNTDAKDDDDSTKGA